MYYWTPGGYPENHDGTYSKWTSANPPKTPDN